LIITPSVGGLGEAFCERKAEGILKEVLKKKGRKDIDYYKSTITKVDKKMLNYLNNAYEILHLSRYYDGITDIKVISRGFELA